MSVPCCMSGESPEEPPVSHPFLQIVSEYRREGVLMEILNAMDIFIELVANPDGFAFTHSMVRALGRVAGRERFLCPCEPAPPGASDRQPP